MAVEANTGSTFNQYTGIGNFNVVAINPTKDELIALGRKGLEKEPEYKITMQEKEYTKLAIYLQGGGTFIDKNGDKQVANLTIPVTFNLSNREDIAQTGSKKIINTFGNNSYSKDIDTLKANPNMTKWFSLDGIRYAYEGEGFLVDFLKAWLKVGKDNKCSIDHWGRLVNGDVSELKTHMSNFKQQTVNALLTVSEVTKDGKTTYYNNVYNRFFTNGDNQSTALWVKHFENGQSKANYQNSFDLQLFNPKSDTPTNMADNKPSANEVF